MDDSLKGMLYFFLVCVILNLALTIAFPNFMERNKNYPYISQYDLNE